MKKPREYWLYEDRDDNRIFHAEPLISHTVHAIEYSAYEQVVKERDEFAYKLAHANEAGVQVTMKLNIALEALKFYRDLDWKVNTETWQHPAREAIAKIEGTK